MSEVKRLPYMDIQPDWSEALRLEKRIWVSCLQPGEKTVHSHLVKSVDNTWRGVEGEGFAVTNQTMWSLTVERADAALSVMFLRPRKLLPLHNRQLLCADVSQSGGLGVCSSENGKLWVWETDTGEARRHLEGHAGDVYTCRFFPSGVVVLSGGADCRLKIWSAQDGTCPRTFTGHSRGITDTAIIDHGRNIISVSGDGTARLWDCGSGQCLETLVSTGCAINSCSLASDSSLAVEGQIPSKEHECGTEGKLLLLACEDGGLRCCDIRDRRTVASYTDSKSPLSACTFLSSSVAMCGDDNGVLTTLDLRNPRNALERFQVYESPVNALMPVGATKCITGFRNGSCIMWNSGDLASNKCSLEVVNLTGPQVDPITSISKYADSIYTSCRDGCIRMYSVT